MPSRTGTARSRKSRPGGAPPAPTLGIDLGASKVVSALVDASGRIVQQSGRHLHANDGPSGVIASVVESARICLDRLAGAPAAIGIGVPGQVEPASGTVVLAPNLAWRHVALGARLERELGGRVLVVNDTRAAAYAEWRRGAGRAADDLFCLFVGTGVGGAAVSGGRLVDGAGHSAGEVGHLTIESGGRPCGCSNRGCLETYVAGAGIASRARELVRGRPREAPGLLRHAERGAALDARAVVAAYRARDPLAVEIVTEVERYLVDGSIAIVNAFDPGTFVMGGGIVTGLPSLVAAVEAGVRARALPSARSVRVVAAALGEDAPVLGAAELARDRPDGWGLAP